MAIPATTSLAALLGDRAASEPEAPAISVHRGDCLGYARWDARSNAVARGLGDRRISPGDRVVLWFGRGQWPDYAVAYAGVIKAGAVAVPLSDERSSIEVARVAGHCGARAIVGDDSLVPDDVLHRAAAWIAGVDEVANGHDEGRLTAPVSGPGPVHITYRSGPLRRPEGTSRTAGAVVSALAGRAAAIAGPRPPTPLLLHAASTGSEVAAEALWFALVEGGGPLLLPTAFDPDVLCGLTAERRVTHWVLHRRLLGVVLDRAGGGRHDLSSLRQVVIAGSATTPWPATGPAGQLDHVSLVAMGAEGPQRSSVPPAASVWERPDRAGSGGDEPPVGEADGDVVGVVAAVCERLLGQDRGGGPGGLFGRSGAMAAVEASDLLEDALEVRMELADLLAAPSVSALAAAVAARHRAVAAEPPGVAPVAFSQEGMLWQEQFVPGSQNLPPLVRRYRGPLRVDVFERALEEIVRRHQPLRTTFELRHGRPVQVVAPAGPLLLAVEDLHHLAPAEQEAAVASRLAAAGRPFDLVAGPLFEPQLIRLGPDDHVVIFRVHHSVYDDWSVGVFRRELSALYAAFAAGEASPLPEPAVGFSDAVRAQRRRLAGPAGTAELAWWKEHLAGAPLCLQLPIDDPDRPEGAPATSAAPVSLELGSDLGRRLRDLARRERSTLFMTVLTAFEVLVHRCTGQPDLLMASVVANRNRTELEGMIGCFTKKVLLRLDATGDPSFTELLARVRARVLGALMHQDLPFETVLQETVGRPASSHGLVPRVAVMFQGVTPHEEELVMAGMTTSGYDTSATTTRAHFAAGAGGHRDPDAVHWGSGLYNGTFLILSVIEGDDRLALSARGAFHGPSVARLLDDFRALLADVVAHPSQPVDALRVPPARRRPGGSDRPVTMAGSDGSAALAPGGAGHAASRPAISTGEQSLSAAQLDARAGALAERLRALGAGRGTRVGVCLHPSIECVVAVLGVWKAGAAYVGLDPDDPDDHLAAVADDAALDLALVEPGRCPTALATRCRLVDVDDPGRDPVPTGDLTAPADRAGDDLPEVATVFYGRRASRVWPGVVIGHRAVLGLCTALTGEVYGSEEPGTGRCRVWLSAGPASDGFLRQLVALLAGHELRVPAEVGQGAVGELVTRLGCGEVDAVDCSPAEATALLEAGVSTALSARPGDAARPVLVVGGRSAVDSDLRRSLAALAGTRVLLVFGPPACCFGATVQPLGGPPRPTIGRPLTGVEVEVLDDRGRPVPVRVTGQLQVGGATLADGYLHDPDRTSDRFAPAGSGPPADEGAGNRSFRTGRLARFLADGTLELLGGASDFLSWRGHRLDRARLEGLLNRAPGVERATVSLGRDEAGEPVLVASVVPAGTGDLPTLAGLRRAVWDELPGYAWPATMEVAGVGAPPEAAPAGPDAALLAGWWGDELGLATVDPDETYWHRFSFLEAVRQARDSGMVVRPEQLVRSRTLLTLAADLDRAGTVRRGGGR